MIGPKPAFRPPALLLVLGPGLLTAATGVGAGDLATAGFAASHLGLAVLWAVVLGAFLKFVLTEGLARWQLATGETLLEGALGRLGRPVRWLFLLYLLPWSFFVGAALMSACGVTAHALVPVFDDPATAKVVLGAAHSAVGVAIVWLGGFRLVERLMAAAIAVMFATVVLTAILMRPDLAALGKGLVIPRIPQAGGAGLTWTIGLMGGVGGTLTILCYGYWIREHGRDGVEHLRTCRIDLAVAYAMTALFGVAMMVIADGLVLDARGAGLIVELAARLEETLGPAGRWIFLAGAWAAVFSSLLGVWQAVPYVFADFCGLTRRQPGRGASPAPVSTRGLAYRAFLLALAIVPIAQLYHPFKDVQKYYAIIGAAFIPLLAITLLLLNGRGGWVGRSTNRPLTTIILVITILLSALAAWFEIRKTS